ncbi:MAG: glutamate ligase domain-containing protein, partial [Bacteroidia bacterium]
MSEADKIKNYHDKLNQSLVTRERVRSSEDDHQLEFVDEIDGIVYINDSKSTRVTSTRYSLEAIETGVLLILGGDDKENDYSILGQQIKQKVVAVIYLGECSDKILKHYSGHNMLFAKATSINESVQIASVYARSGDAVLFSPACPSYHEFDNYKSRGNDF